MEGRSVGSTGDRALFFRRSGRAAWQTVPVNGAFFSSYSAGVNMLIANKVALIGKKGGDRLFCFKHLPPNSARFVGPRVTSVAHKMPNQTKFNAKTIPLYLAGGQAKKTRVKVTAKGLSVR